MLSAACPLRWSPAGSAGRPGRARRPAWGLAATLCAGLLLTGCGDKQVRNNHPVAVRVNGDDITVLQLNALLQQQRGLRPEQAEAASRQLLERLIDQQLALQQAEHLGLDRDPRVLLQLEAARREALARAYAERLGEQLPALTEADLQAYYQAKPALFAQRKVYQVLELQVDARPEQWPALREQYAAAGDAQRFAEAVRAQGGRVATNVVRRPAEQWPLPVLERLATLAPGQSMVAQSALGFQVLQLQAAEPQPLSPQQAQPLIEQLLGAERKRERLEQELRALRAKAKLQYLGRFSAPASAPAATGG